MELGPTSAGIGIWQSISLLVLDSDRIRDVHLLQRHENGRVYLTPKVTTQQPGAEIRITVTTPDGVDIQMPDGIETTVRRNVVMEQGNPDYTAEAQLCVANETCLPVSGTVRWALRHADGRIIEQGSRQVTVPALESQWLDNMDFHKTDMKNHYLCYSLEIRGTEISSGTALFTAPKHFKFCDRRLRCERSGNQITVYADAYARSAEIDSPDSDIVLSDNYF